MPRHAGRSWLGLEAREEGRGAAVLSPGVAKSGCHPGVPATSARIDKPSDVIFQAGDVSEVVFPVYCRAPHRHGSLSGSM